MLKLQIILQVKMAMTIFGWEDGKNANVRELAELMKLVKYLVLWLVKN